MAKKLGIDDYNDKTDEEWIKSFLSKLSEAAGVPEYDTLKKQGIFKEIPVSDYVAAVSTGLSGGDVVLDLSYQEDSRASVDMNIVMTGSGKFIEIQGTAEGEPFSSSDLHGLIAAAAKGIASIVKVQKKALHDCINTHGNAA